MAKENNKDSLEQTGEGRPSKPVDTNYNNKGRSSRKYRRGKGNTKKNFESKDANGRMQSAVQSPLVNSSYRSIFKNEAVRLWVSSDPRSNGSKVATTLPIIGSRNSLQNVNYTGENNIGGDEIVRYVNSNMSGFLYTPDIISQTIELRYQYYKFNDARSEMMTAQHLIAYLEARSYIVSTQTWQLPFFQMSHAIKSDFDSEKTKLEKDPNYKVKIDTDKGEMGALNYYQTVVQGACMLMNKTNSTFSMEQILKDHGYNRESALITEIFGQIQKGSTRNAISSVQTNIQGEFTDMDWWNQMKAYYSLPSKVSNSMDDPIITLITYYNPEDIVIFAKGKDSQGNDTLETIFDTSTLTLSYETINPTEEVGAGVSLVKRTNVKIGQLFRDYMTMMDISTIAAAARSSFARVADNSIPETVDLFEVNWFPNCIKSMCTALNKYFLKFKSVFSELRTMLEKCNTMNFTYWKKGMAFNLFNTDVNMSLTNQLFINDVVRLSKSGSKSFDWNNTVSRYTFYTTWDAETGIPKYDQRNGGVYLTLSTKSITGDTTDKSFPILFDVDPTVGKQANTLAILRNGFIVQIDRAEVSVSEMRNNPVLSRLDPMASMPGDISIWIPEVKFDKFTLSKSNSALLHSFVAKTVMNVYNMAKIEDNYLLDKRIISFVNIQAADFESQVQQFTRAYCPFRVVNSLAKRPLGIEVYTRGKGLEEPTEKF